MSVFFIDKRRDKIRYEQLDTNLRGYNLTEYVNVSTNKGDDCYMHYFYATPINNQTLKLLRNNHTDRLACIYINKASDKVLFIRYDGLAKTFDDYRIVVYDYWTIKDTTLMLNDNTVDYYVEKINRDELIFTDTDKNSIDDFEYVGYAHWRYFDKGILYYGTRYSSDEGVIRAVANDDLRRDNRDFLESFIMYAAVHENKFLWSRNQINDFIERFQIQTKDIVVVVPNDKHENVLEE